MEFLFRIVGSINLLRGCFIFFIFVFKDSILDKVFFSYSIGILSFTQVGRITVLGVRLRFLRRKNINRFDSLKMTSLTSDR